MDAQFCEYIYNYCIVCFEWVNCTVCEFSSIKLFKKQKNKNKKYVPKGFVKIYVELVLRICCYFQINGVV